MEPKEASAGGVGGEKKERGLKRRNRLFLRYLERRKTDTIVNEDKGDFNISTLVRRSQSDKTEYSSKLKEKMAPQKTPSTTSLELDPEEVRERKMIRRSKVIQELLQTEQDYLTDLELCIREVVQPLREAQVVDVDQLFTNIEAVCEMSAELLAKLREATEDADLEAQILGDVFIQAKVPLEEVYKVYCYQHDDCNALLKAHEKDDEIRQHFTTCISKLKQIYDKEGKPNLLDMGSLMIKPVQRIMKYPLLLGELWQATPCDHPDHQPLAEALTTAKIINININEFKRRKDIVMKYKRPEEEGTLISKLNKFSIHSIRKKSDRFTSYLKILTGAEPQIKDEVFDREEKLFRHLEKAVRQLVKNVCCFLHHVQELVSLAIQHSHDLESIIKDPDKTDNNGSLHKKNGSDPYRQFKDGLERTVLTPLSTLQGMFAAPQKLIQKRYDKLLDYCSKLERTPSEEQEQTRRDYQALNAQLVEELQRFNKSARTILDTCVCSLVGLTGSLVEACQSRAPAFQQLPAPLSNISEVQNCIMESLNNLTFVKDNAQKLMERKVSFEKTKKALVPEVPRQSESQRERLLASYPASRLYQLKRNCNASQEKDVSLLEGDVVGLVEDTDPMGSTSRWLIDTGGEQGYVYSSFLKPFNPCREHSGSRCEQPEDFDNLSLFVCGGGGGAAVGGSLPRFGYGATDEGLSPHILQGETLEVCVDGDAEEQQFYAVYAFHARCQQELTLQEYQHVRILQFCDLSGNKEWWLAESGGQKGYVPANYLGRMSYA